MGHQCEVKDQRELPVLLVCEDTELEVFEDANEEFEPVKLKTMVVNNTVELLNYVVGLSNPRTIKMRGEISRQKVVVLIDYGATHVSLLIE